jgi:hypothetical protein
MMRFVENALRATSSALNCESKNLFFIRFLRFGRNGGRMNAAHRRSRNFDFCILIFDFVYDSDD